MTQLLAALKAQITPLFDSELAKLAAVGTSVYGVQGGNHWLTIFGGGAYVLVHFVDSVFNSPTGTKPGT